MDGFKPIRYMGNITVEDAVVDEIIKLYDKEKTVRVKCDIDKDFFKKNYNKFTPGLINVSDMLFNYTIKYYYIVLEEKGKENEQIKKFFGLKKETISKDVVYRYLYFDVVNIIKEPKKV